MCAVLQRPECWEATHFLCLVHTSNRAPMGTNCHLAICNCEWEQCATDWGTKSTCFDDPFTSVISRYICLRNFRMEFGWFCIASCMQWKLLVPYWWVLLCCVGVSWQGIGNVWWDYSTLNCTETSWTIEAWPMLDGADVSRAQHFS